MAYLIPTGNPSDMLPASIPLFLQGSYADIPSLSPGQMYFATDQNCFYAGTPNGNVAQTSSGGSSLQTMQILVDFGIDTPEETTATTTVPASWVTPSSFLMCSVVEGGDHTADEIAAEQVTATIGNIQSGTSFDIVLSSMNGSSGTFLVNVQGQ